MLHLRNRLKDLNTTLHEKQCAMFQVDLAYRFLKEGLFLHSTH